MPSGRSRRKLGCYTRACKRLEAALFGGTQDAVEVFYDDLACTMADPDHHAEQRFVTIGLDAFRRLLVVVYAQTDERAIRIISARQATAAERRHYEQG